MKKILRYLWAGLLCAAVMSGASCGKQPTQEKQTQAKKYTDIVLGTDYTDLKTKITVLTHRTDIIQDTNASNELPDYIAKFNAMYPNIDVEIQGVNDYDFDVINRLPSKNWGDVCFIPGTLEPSEMTKYFEPFGQLDNFGDTYEFIENKAYNNIVYGIPSEGNAQGIVYNKRVWEEAGITSMPKTTDEFLDDLQKIKDNTDAMPLYTNYSAEWPLTTWDYHAFSAAVGDEDYRNITMVNTDAPFSKQADNTGPYEVYRVLYEAVARNLVDESSQNIKTETSWELSKSRINNGEIGCMVLGSWAVSQMQSEQAGPNGDDISYMPFPITIDGTQYALAGSDYCYAVNKNISDDKKLAAQLYIKFMTEQSGYAFDNSCIPIIKGAEYPDIFKNFKDVTLINDIAPSETFKTINTKSGIGFTEDPQHIKELIDAAKNGTPLDDIVKKWDEAWSSARDASSSAEVT